MAPPVLPKPHAASADEALAALQSSLHGLSRMEAAVAAQLLHIGSMYTPWIGDVLRVQPVSLDHWLELLGLALIILVTMEFHKAFRSVLVRSR